MAKDFQSRLAAELLERESMTTREVYAFFGDMNPKTVSWHLFECLEEGVVVRTGHGRYALSRSMPEVDERLSHIPSKSCILYDFMCRSGFDFYMSGLDCMNGLGLEVSSGYPVVFCCRRRDVKDVQMEVMRHLDLVLTEADSQMLCDDALKRRIQYVVLGSDDFTLQRGGFAFLEKAFVDLYYAATRLEYPVGVGELPGILSLFDLNPYRFRRATKDRRISPELDFLLCYNKDFMKAFADIL